MGLLEGKNALIFGVANNQSIAFGIAKKLSQEGAQICLSCQNETLVNLVKIIAKDLNTDFVLKCDLLRDEDIINLREKIKEKFKYLDVIIHSVAFAPKETFEGGVLDTRRESFKIAFDISVYSLLAICREFLPLMEGREGSIITLSYYGSQKVIPHYNLMGVAKSALECLTRYLAVEMGKFGHRVNCISPGPIKTLAASAIPGFDVLYQKAKEVSPIKKEIDIFDVGDLAVFLASGLSKKITGQVIFLDGGYQLLGFY